MYNPGKIITILALFVLLITAPILLNIGKASEPPAPSLDTAAIEQLDEKQCIESKEFMRKHHPKLLSDWREQAVREGETEYISSSGETWEMSLENNCLQ